MDAVDYGSLTRPPAFAIKDEEQPSGCERFPRDPE